MAIIPAGQQFNTLSSGKNTTDYSSALTNSGRATYSMQDIADSVFAVAGEVGGSGTAGKIPLWATTGTISDSIISQDAGDAGITVGGTISVSELNEAPADSGSAGRLGEIRWTADYVYLCIATNIWTRAALASW